MCSQDTITTPKESLLALGRKSWRAGVEFGPSPDLSTGPAPKSLSPTLASFQSRDMAKGSSQLLHLTGTAPKSQGWTMISLSMVMLLGKGYD